MSLYKTYKSGEESINEFSHIQNWETEEGKLYVDATPTEIKAILKSQVISIIKGEIERLETRKVDENANIWGMDYNQAISDQISHLQSELLAIEENK